MSYQGHVARRRAPEAIALQESVRKDTLAYRVIIGYVLLILHIHRRLNDA